MTDFEVVWNEETGEWDARFSGQVSTPIEKPVQNSGRNDFPVDKAAPVGSNFFTHTRGIIFLLLIALAPIVALWRGTGDAGVLNFILGLCIGGVILLIVDRFKNNG